MSREVKQGKWEGAIKGVFSKEGMSSDGPGRKEGCVSSERKLQEHKQGWNQYVIKIDHRLLQNRDTEHTCFI